MESDANRAVLVIKSSLLISRITGPPVNAGKSTLIASCRDGVVPN